MTKKKKTRREKEISRLRRELHITANSSGQYSFLPTKSPENAQKISSPMYYSIATRDYSYVLSDVKKTLSITSILFIGNLILYFLITKNILHIFK